MNDIALLLIWNIRNIIPVQIFQQQFQSKDLSVVSVDYLLDELCSLLRALLQACFDYRTFHVCPAPASSVIHSVLAQCHSFLVRTAFQQFLNRVVPIFIPGQTNRTFLVKSATTAALSFAYCNACLVTPWGYTIFSAGDEMGFIHQGGGRGYTTKFL